MAANALPRGRLPPAAQIPSGQVLLWQSARLQLQQTSLVQSRAGRLQQGRLLGQLQSGQQLRQQAPLVQLAAGLLQQGRLQVQLAGGWLLPGRLSCSPC